MEIPLYNKSFRHNGHTVPDRPSDNLKWIYQDSEIDVSQHKFVCLTDEFLFQPDVPRNGIGLIIESQGIIPDYYKALYSYPKLSHYHLIFTHSQFLLDNYHNTRWIPGGGVWIGTKYGGGEVKIHPKTKNVSFVSSKKNMCWMHYSRMMMAKYFIDFKCPVDIYGDIVDKWVPIIDTLQDYRYSIIIENYIDDRYFTEKLLNCFATGCIPIYWGSRKINEFFNTDGMIIMKSPGDASRCLEWIGEEHYNSKMDAIKDNFERVQKYLCIEDYIYENYLKIYE
jgi:hypothetical protein